MEYNVFFSAYVIIGTLIYVNLPGNVLGYASNEYLTTLSENVNYLSKLHERSMRFDKKISDLRKEMQLYIEGNDKKLAELEAKLATLESCKDAVPTRPNCRLYPGDWVSFDDSCYLFASGVQLSFSDAEQYCVQNGSNLVHIDTEEENSFLKQHLKSIKTVTYWIGMTDRSVEGSWEWYDNNEALNFTDWCSGEPNDSRKGEDCAAFSESRNVCWNDLKCGDLAVPLCELKDSFSYH